MRNVVIAIVVATATVVITAFGVEDGDADALTLVLCAIPGLALAFRTRFPVGQYAVALGAVCVYNATGQPGGPMYAVAFASALLMVAEARAWLAPVAIGAAAFMAAEVVDSGWTAHAFAAGATFLLGPPLFGQALRFQQARRELTERTREEEARRHLAEERLEIARDVHDVVGHSLATIALQAGVAEHLATDDTSREALKTIRRLSKESLAEVGAMLDVLREGAAERAPARDLATLVSEVRNAGLDVELHADGSPVSGTVYRIVQESLTNVVRHAGPGATARVQVQTHDGQVEVEVRDDGCGPGATLHEGNGLTGMRERAAKLGGTFSAGAATDGGFAVKAVLPAR
ncbi:histidine kinase [Solirubrobacter taibaiensis]|nr:histidine kinase [Solirubrobacter taibaiensis]